MNLPEMPAKYKGLLRRRLPAWYRRNARDLPWRRTRDPYAVWVSEIMLQQTRAAQAEPYYLRFMAAFPTVRSLAAAEEDHVLKLWEGLGYYHRARNLYKAAQHIVQQRNGCFPETAAEWRHMPGVGRYTAGAIASIAFGECVPVLDGNVIRVFTRILNIGRPIEEPATLKALWRAGRFLVQGSAPGDFNQALMELGARVCTPRNPACGVCPVRVICGACAKGVQEQRPVRKPKKGIPHYEVVVAAIRKNGRYLIAKRPPHGLLAGLWEFPGGKVRADETHRRALIREIKEELGVSVRVGECIATVNHAYSHFRVTLNVYRCEQVGGSPQPKSHTALKWVRPEDFHRFAFPKANHKFLEALGNKPAQNRPKS